MSDRYRNTPEARSSSLTRPSPFSSTSSSSGSRGSPGRVASPLRVTALSRSSLTSPRQPAAASYLSSVRHRESGTVSSGGLRSSHSGSGYSDFKNYSAARRLNLTDSKNISGDRSTTSNSRPLGSSNSFSQRSGYSSSYGVTSSQSASSRNEVPESVSKSNKSESELRYTQSGNGLQKIEIQTDVNVVNVVKKDDDVNGARNIDVDKIGTDKNDTSRASLKISNSDPKFSESLSSKGVAEEMATPRRSASGHSERSVGKWSMQTGAYTASSKLGHSIDTQVQRQTSDSVAHNEGDSSTVPKPPRRRLTKKVVCKKHVDDDEYIGFASLPEQVHRKAVKRGFEFTLMVVGETGLGKSTLINSLFLTDLYKDRKFSSSEERISKTVDIEKKELEIEERGVKLRLTIVDTPGFNDALNGEESWKSLVSYIDKQYDYYFQQESGVNRKNIQDTRVHCLLYFISPFGHGLRPVDILVMKKLHHKVNIIPLIAKADMLTKVEVKRLKERTLDEIKRHNIHIYQFPDCDSDEDDEFKQQDRELKQAIPFAVVGSNTVVEAGGKKIRGRMYPWGIVEVENPKHCDFIRLRQMLISTHMQDLKDVTSDIHYENYRAEHLSEEMNKTQKERMKLKRESGASESVGETEKLLQQKEAEIQRMQAMLAKMQAQLQNKNNPSQMNGRVEPV